MKFKIIIQGLFIVCICCCMGCATVFSHSQYDVEITTVPENARYTILNEKGKVVSRGATPKVVELKSSGKYFGKAEYNLLIEKPGYLDEERELSASLDNCVWFNLLWPFGVIIDVATGSMWKLPEEMPVELVRVDDFE